MTGTRCSVYQMLEIAGKAKRRWLVLTDILNGLVEIISLLLAAGEVPKPSKVARSLRPWARYANTSTRVEPSR